VTLPRGPDGTTGDRHCLTGMMMYAMLRSQSSTIKVMQLAAYCRQVEAAQLQKHAPGDVAAAFVAVLADDGCLPRAHPAASGSGGGDASEQLRLTVKSLVGGLRAAAPTLPCAWDASLPADPGKCVPGSPRNLLAYVHITFALHAALINLQEASAAPR
jgi:hypothetical protein